MTPTAPSAPDPAKSLLCAVLDNGDIALVRVVGRGNFSNSVPFKNFAAKLQATGKDLKFVIDLQNCDSMDSTFMGVLAGICLTQLKGGLNKVIVVNANDHCKRLLKNLGLTHLLELRTGPLAEVERAEDVFAPAKETQANRIDQICMMLEAHKELVRLDSKNEVQFQAVIEYLEKSLQDEGGCPPPKH